MKTLENLMVWHKIVGCFFYDEYDGYTFKPYGKRDEEAIFSDTSK